MLGKKKSQSGNISVQLVITPTDGDPTKKDVEVPMTGTTIADVLNASGVKPEGKDLFLNGKPATLETHVTDGQSVNAKNRKPEVRAAERPRGS